MKYLTIIALCFFPLLLISQSFSVEEMNAWKKEAKQVRIIRDTWGIAHVYGKTDADAVFGLMYAQCEENFARVERNYLEMLGRLAEIDGAGSLPNDLEMKVIYDSSAAMEDYAKAPAWFKKLLDAFADGINFYLAVHPDVHPALLNRFQPWYPLLFTDGSISATQTGGLTETDIKNLYFPDLPRASASLVPPAEADSVSEVGSNGFAIGPSRTASGHALLYINPHVSFYFRTEVQMVSEEGLNAYGAVTWGQFFVYQGFNEHCGWMHTSSNADVADLYLERVIKKGDSLFYQYSSDELSIRTKPFALRYKSPTGESDLRVQVYYTRHGPVMGSREGQWLSLKERNRSMSALMQSWLRTKANSFASFKQVMDMRSNNSNNTVYADDKGNIAYWHGNFMPVRDTSFDWSKPVDGTNPATEWKGIHPVEEVIHIYNPLSGWIQNCNSTPFEASGSSSPNREAYPAYMAPDGQNARALNAIRVLSRERRFTLDKLISAGYDRYLPAFQILLPSLLKAFEALAPGDSLKQSLSEPVRSLRDWDFYADEHSVATTLAVFWGLRLIHKASILYPGGRMGDQVQQLKRIAEIVPGKEKLASLSEALQELISFYGSWKTEWGSINRYQRTEGMTRQTFSDELKSWPAGSTSSRWGCLPAFESRPFANTLKWYGYAGNSFVAAVEFGDRVRARTVITGGQSFDPNSKHFTDQAERYIQGDLKDVLFYKEDLDLHTQRSYHPGE